MAVSEGRTTSEIYSEEGSTQVDPSTLMTTQTSVPAGSDDGPDSTLMIVIFSILAAVCVTGVILMLCWRRRRRSTRRYKEVPDTEATPKKPERHQEVPMKEADVQEISEQEVHVVPLSKDAPYGPRGIDNQLPEQEVKEFVRKLTGRHCGRLVDALVSKKKVEQPLDVIIDENREVLFDAQKMLFDWLEKQTCSVDEKRRLLLAGAEKTGRGTLDDFKRIGDDELQQIIKRMDTPSIANNVCETLGVTYSYDDSKSDLFEKLSRWRDGESKIQNITVSVAERYKRFLNAIKLINISSVTSSSKRNVSEKIEFFNLALELFMQDLRPLAAALGIDETEMINYRQQYSDKHTSNGTIVLLKELKNQEENKWERMCRALKNLGYFDIAQMGLSGNYKTD